MPGAITYWNWFEKMVGANKITSRRRAIDEVLAGGKKGQAEEIVSWVKTRQGKLIDSAPDSQACQDLVGELCAYSWTKFGGVKTVEFTKGADLWLITRAELNDGAVVTQRATRNWFASQPSAINSRFASERFSK